MHSFLQCLDLSFVRYFCVNIEIPFDFQEQFDLFRIHCVFGFAIFGRKLLVLVQLVRQLLLEIIEVCLAVLHVKYVRRVAVVNAVDYFAQ